MAAMRGTPANRDHADKDELVPIVGVPAGRQGPERPLGRTPGAAGRAAAALTE